MTNVRGATKELLLFVPSVLVAIGIYFFLVEQARPFTPPEAHIFQREPVLEGVYRLEHHQGRNATVSYAGDTLISCRMPSYFIATLLAGSASHDCGLERELNGKLVRIERVRVPTKNKEAGAFVVRITYDGRDYRHLSDEGVRTSWIAGTQQDASYAASYIWVFLVFFQLCFTYRKEILREFRRDRT